MMKTSKAALSILMSFVLAFSMTFAFSPVNSAYATSGNVTAGKISTQSKKISLSKCNITLSATSYTYDGKAKKPGVSVVYSGKKVSSKNYTVTYKNNTKVGTGKVVIKAKGSSYSGSVTKTFSINSVSRGSITIKTPQEKYQYTGSAIVPEVTVKSGTMALVKGVDYTVAYENNVDYGTARIKVTFKGNYKNIGEKTTTFKITKPDLESSKITIPSNSYAFEGSNVEPIPTINCGGKILVQDQDYRVSYSNNRKPGEAKVKIRGMGNYSGSRELSFTIYDEIIGVEISKSDCTYKKGKKQQAKVKTVLTKSGVNIRSSKVNVAYNRGSKKTTDFVSAGTITVKVTGKEKYYKGSASESYVINKAVQKANYRDINKRVKADRKTGNSTSTFSYTIKDKKLDGKINYKLTSADKGMSLSGKKLTLAKGSKKGTYEGTVVVSVAGNSNYEPFSTEFDVKLTVK